jgi:ElaA protein
MKIDWRWSAFAELNLRELYEILKLRQEVFIVEQQCPYPDADGRDIDCYHLMGWEKLAEEEGNLIAYMRILPPGLVYKELTMGRILTAEKARGSGVGRELMKEGLSPPSNILNRSTKNSDSGRSARHSTKTEFPILKC